MFFLVIAFGCQACDWFGNTPDFSDDFVTYTIKAGAHDAENTQGFPVFHNSNRLEFQAIFDESCQYTNRVPGNVHDINKLMGFSDCGTLHHESSARFGWNWMEGELRIYSYVYVDKVRIPETFLGAVELNKTHHFKIEAQDNQYVFTLNGKAITTPRQCKGDVGKISYKLYPYFGGDETAPQDIRIKIRTLK